MDTAGGMDWQAKRLEGKVFTVRYIDSAEQIHIEETGIALIPGVSMNTLFSFRPIDLCKFTPINQSFDFHLTRCRMAANG